MINELYGLATTLENKGISSQEWHREYKPIPNVTSKSPCIRIWIAEDGTVCDYESIGTELAKSLRKFGNNQGTFPAFNIVSLYRLTNEEYFSELEKYKKDSTKLNLSNIKSWCVNDNWKDSIVKKVNRSLHDIPQRLIELIDDSGQIEENIILELARLTKQFSNNSDGSFRASLETCILTKLQRKEDVSLSLSLLVHNGDPQKDPKKDVGASLSVILDVQSWERYGFPVANKYTTEWLNERLLTAARTNTTVEASSNIDAFGTPFLNPNEPMPSVKLSGIEVSLRSMFNGQPCQYRYEQIDDESYPIAMENRSLIKKSLEWIANSTREGITWRKADKNEIVFIYPSKLPEIPPKYASIFGVSLTESPSKTKARFENVAKEFIKTLNGIPTNERSDSIQIFTLRKIDKARSKVIFTHNTTPEKLAKAAEEWEHGCHNIPSLDCGEQISPFPLQIAKVINNVWKQNGELAQGKNTVERMKFYQGIELLLDIMQESMIENFLHITLSNSSGLVNYIGNWIHGGVECKNKNEEMKLENQIRESLLVFSVLGLLLYKCDERKENYMENVAYLIGQVLHISDGLHALYCRVVRNGDIPPQLAGSALFVTAGEMPNLALSQLSVRMNPYIAWSKQYRYKNVTEKGKESWRAGWYLNLFESTANKIAPAISDVIRFTDFEKAQLFIGYMASFPKREISKATTDSNENEGGFEK